MAAHRSGCICRYRLAQPHKHFLLTTALYRVMPITVNAAPDQQFHIQVQALAPATFRDIAEAHHTALGAMWVLFRHVDDTFASSDEPPAALRASVHRFAPPAPGAVPPQVCFGTYHGHAVAGDRAEPVRRMAYSLGEGARVAVSAADLGRWLQSGLAQAVDGYLNLRDRFAAVDKHEVWQRLFWVEGVEETLEEMATALNRLNQTILQMGVAGEDVAGAAARVDEPARSLRVLARFLEYGVTHRLGRVATAVVSTDLVVSPRGTVRAHRLIANLHATLCALRDPALEYAARTVARAQVTGELLLVCRHAARAYDVYTNAHQEYVHSGRAAAYWPAYGCVAPLLLVVMRMAATAFVATGELMLERRDARPFDQWLTADHAVWKEFRGSWPKAGETVVVGPAVVEHLRAALQLAEPERSAVVAEHAAKNR